MCWYHVLGYSLAYNHSFWDWWVQKMDRWSDGWMD